MKALYLVKLLLVTICILQISCKVQYRKVVVVGKVLSEQGSSDVVSGIPIYLRINDTTFVCHKTNEKGEYIFNVNKANNDLKLCIEGIKKNIEGIKKNAGYLTCNNTRTLKLDRDTIRVSNIYVSTNAIYDTPVLNVLFKQNSLEMARDTRAVPFIDLPGDSAIKQMFNFLNENPSLKIQLNGHCDTKEKDKDTLSLSRSKFVANKLVELGISRNRITTKGFGSENCLINEKSIIKAKKKEKIYLRQLNRRVVLSITSNEK